MSAINLTAFFAAVTKGLNTVVTDAEKILGAVPVAASAASIITEFPFQWEADTTAQRAALVTSTLNSLFGDLAEEGLTVSPTDVALVNTSVDQIFGIIQSIQAIPLQAIEALGADIAGMPK